MNFPGVIAGDPEMLAPHRGRRARGGSTATARACSGRALDAYLAAGVESDHECTRLEEAVERRRKGMWVFIRQGSASQNLEALIPDVLEHGPELAAFCTDDREPDTLLQPGHINDCARLAVAAGVSEIDALLLASTNPARYHGFHAPRQPRARPPGRRPLLRRARQLAAGARVAGGPAGGRRAGELVPARCPSAPVPELMRGTVNLGDAAGAERLALTPRRRARACARSAWRAAASPRATAS